MICTSVFHLCSSVTLHWRLTSRICNDRPVLLYFFNVLDQTCLSLSLWLPKSHQRSAHKWGGVQTDTGVLFIRTHFPPSFPGWKPLRVCTLHEHLHIPRGRMFWEDASLAWQLSHGAADWPPKTIGPNKTVPRPPRAKKQQNPPQWSLPGWGCQTRRDEGGHCFNTLRFISLKANYISLDQRPPTRRFLFSDHRCRLSFTLETCWRSMLHLQPIY